MDVHIRALIQADSWHVTLRRSHPGDKGDNVMTTTSARSHLWIVLLLLGMLVGNLGFAAAPPSMHQVAQSPQGTPKSPAAEYVPNLRFRLRTALAEGKLVPRR